ncbi:MAG: glycosyltransferase [Ignavibacteria bacterium]
MKILFISYDFPFPPTGGSISRDYNLIKQLSKHHELHWINRTIRGKIKQEYKDEMKKYFRKMDIIEWDYDQDPAGLLKSMVTNVPYIIKRFESNEMKELVSKTIRENDFDLILCDHIYLSQYIPESIAGSIPVIPNNEDCGFTYYKRMTENSGFARSVYARSQWKKLLDYEIEVLKKYNVYITTSEKEKELISQYYNQAEICVIENGVDTDYFSPGKEMVPVRI